ncbi:MAG TPA: hypothetical protein VGK73_04030 [Polyangiaceae bacterium]
MGYNFDGFPLHRLNTAHMTGWLLSRVLKREMASFLSKSYRTGCVVLSPSLRAVALVDPRGNITELPPPHRAFKFWQLANKPSLRAGECACRNFWDPETEGAWGDRHYEREHDIHHPHCQSREVAEAAWVQAKKSAEARVAEKKTPQLRPDEWSRDANALEGNERIVSR